jgi:hypothetical protein
MDSLKGAALPLVVLILLLAAAGSCLKWTKHEDCEQRGGRLVRTTGSEYACENPQVK